jgi:cytochrome P450
MTDVTGAVQQPVREPNVGDLGSVLGTENVDHGSSDYYDRLRELGPIVWDPGVEAWLVTSYDLVREMAARDNIDWRSPMALANERPMGLGRELWTTFQGGSPWGVAMLEGPAHRDAHRWWMNAFSEKSLGVWNDRLIVPVSHAQLDRFADRGRAELTGDYANRVAPRVIAAVLGLPWDDEQWMEELVALPPIALQIFEGMADETQKQAAVERAMAAQMKILDMLHPFVLEHSDGTGDDLISIFWRDAPELMGEDYDAHDIVAQVSFAFQGGSDTTANTTANCIYLLLTQPELQERVRAGGIEATRAFVEETMRLYSTIALRPRIAIQDTELAGVTVRQGEQVIELVAGSQRDGRHYPYADVVDLDRPKPKDHFAFGRGPRQCPGRALARLELVSIISVLLERFDELRIDEDAPPPQYIGWLQRHWTPLHTVFRERSGQAA